MMNSVDFETRYWDGVRGDVTMTSPLDSADDPQRSPDGLCFQSSGRPVPNNLD